MLLTLLMEFFYEHGGKQNKQVRYEKKWTPDYNNLTMRYPIYFYPYLKRMGHTIWVVVMGQSGHISAKLFSLLSPITLPDLLDKQRERFLFFSKRTRFPVKRSKSGASFLVSNCPEVSLSTLRILSHFESFPNFSFCLVFMFESLCR